MKTIKSSILWLMLLVSLLSPVSSFAEELQTDIAGDYIELNKGETAPFSGFLLEREALINLVVERQQIVSTLELKTVTEVKKVQLQLDTVEKKKDAQLQINKETCDSILKIKQDTIEQYSSKTKWNDLYYVGGFVSGFVVSLSIFYISVQVTK